jgi:hypothetical protein
VKVGDLICYNAAGMRKETLGMVLSEWIDAGGKRYIMIKWALKGKYMPKSSWEYYNHHNISQPWTYLPPGGRGPEGDTRPFLWYDDAHYFEVI